VASAAAEATQVTLDREFPAGIALLFDLAEQLVALRSPAFQRWCR
jgi:hypothetical protein